MLLKRVQSVSRLSFSSFRGPPFCWWSLLFIGLWADFLGLIFGSKNLPRHRTRLLYSSRLRSSRCRFRGSSLSLFTRRALDYRCHTIHRTGMLTNTVIYPHWGASLPAIKFVIIIASAIH